jgi:membrane protein required for colicin V production
MELTIADGVVALVMLVSAVLAYSRGVTREALAIGGWVAAGMSGFFFAPMVSPLILELPVVGAFLNGSCSMTALASFSAVFGVTLIVLSIFTPVLSQAVQSTFLGPVDKGLGFVFGLARGLLLIGVLYLLYDMIVPADDRLAVIDNSASHDLLAEAAKSIQGQTPKQVPDWLQYRIDHLIGECGDASENAALIAPARAVAVL